MLLSSEVPCNSSTAAFHGTVIFSVYTSEESKMGYFKPLSYFQCTDQASPQLDTTFLNRLFLHIYPLPYCDFVPGTADFQKMSGNTHFQYQSNTVWWFCAEGMEIIYLQLGFYFLLPAFPVLPRTQRSWL